MSVLEKDIEQTVVDWAKEHRFLALKVTFTENGYPDRLFISPYGHTIFIEFKRPGETPRRLQSHRIADLIQRGVPATWTCSAVEAINMLRACLEPTRLPNESDKASFVPSSSGPIFGPGTGQDEYRISGSKDSILQGLGKALSGDSSAKTYVQRVAGRDKEMGQLQFDFVQHSARDPESDGPDYGRADTLD